MKRLLRPGLDAPLEVGLSLEQEVLFRLRHIQHEAEDLSAFVQKRSAHFEAK